MTPYIYPGLKKDTKFIVPKRTMDTIFDIVCTYFSLNKILVKSKSRQRNLVYARQCTMLLVREYTQNTLIAVGKFVGGRDHTTTIYGIVTIKNLIHTDPSVREDIENIRKKINTI